MTRWYDAPDGWRDRVQAVVCQVFGCACCDPAAAEGSDGGKGEAPSEPPGAVQDAAPTNPYEAERSVRTRTRRTARDRRRVGVVAPAAPTTLQRNGPAA